MMKLQLREIALELDETEALLPHRVAEQLDLNPSDIHSWSIVRMGIDARRKPRVRRIYTVEFELDEQLGHRIDIGCHPRLSQVEPPPRDAAIGKVSPQNHALVVGMGPAGLFAALHLAHAGARVTLIERGEPVEKRLRRVEQQWKTGLPDPESNVQFGEGGAGTFSDGKLTSRLNHPLTRYVLETLVGFGAPRQIMMQAKPHVGSDRLRRVLVNFRRELQRAGVDLRFSSRLTGLQIAEERVVAAEVNGSEEVPCDALVLAPGHSARDTYRLLSESGIMLEVKPFAVGVRVEHPAALINRIQYGMESHPQLPAADYALAWNDPDSGRGIYSFCMCPGGVVINASSELDGLVVNGMSDYRRAGLFSNSALVVSVRPEDFDGADPLAGVRFQQHWERRAFQAGGGQGLAPAQPLLDFLGVGRGRLHSTLRPGVTSADLAEVLPEFVRDGLKLALPHFDRRMRGFVSGEATLVGIESRTSAPLRILRDRHCESVSHRGLYPAGEGAGYAGGIMSAAIDGVRVAQSVIERLTSKKGSF